MSAPSWCELALLCLPVARVASQSNSLQQRGGRSRPALGTDRVLCALREFQVKEKKKKKCPFGLVLVRVIVISLMTSNIFFVQQTQKLANMDQSNPCL